MRRVQLSSLILTGQLSRSDALAILEEPPLSPEFSRLEFDYVASKLRISNSELHSYLNSPLKFYQDYPNMSKLLFLGETVYSKLLGSRRGGAY